MKLFSYLFCTSLLLLSCTFGTSPVNYSSQYYDEFKDQQTFVLKQQFQPSEHNSGIQSVHFEFLSKLGNSQNGVEMFLNITRDSNAQPIENQLYLKVNEKTIYTLPLKIFESKSQESNITEMTTPISTDSSGTQVSDSGQTTVIKWNSDNYKAIISEELVHKIKNSNAITWRLYSGAMPSSFILYSSKMDKFNAFLNQKIPQQIN
jgi:hypothetical protein